MLCTLIDGRSESAIRSSVTAREINNEVRISTYLNNGKTAHFRFVMNGRYLGPCTEGTPSLCGLIYFLRTSEDKVMTLFDHESQDFGVQDADPLKSSFVPRENLVMVRAPKTRFVVSQTFSGPPLDAGDPIELTADPKDWPESETYCDIPWTELRARLGTQTA